jgi:hypothetical protein
MKVDRITAKSDIIRRVGVVCKRELETKFLGVESDREFDVASAENGVGLFEHRRIKAGEHMRLGRSVQAQGGIGEMRLT